MPNFVGLKNTDDNLALVSRLMSRLGPDFRIFGGLESTAFAMWGGGSRGRRYPEIAHECVDRYAGGERLQYAGRVRQ